jgi:DNA-binding LacI/PurR family transcriptional regulator
MKKTATIQDVAKLAGVSKSTVSKYLNENQHVSAETRKRIGQAIKELGFKPNSLARGLAFKATGLIGLVISDFDNLFNMELIKSIDAEAEKFGYNIVLVCTRDDADSEMIMPEILAEKYKHLDGIILTNARENGIEISKIAENFEHLVLVHRHTPACSTDYAVVDGYVGGRLAAEYLIGLGHRKLAMISGPRTIYQFKERVRGFQDVLREHGLSEQGVVVDVGQHMIEGYRAAEKLVLEHSITAIFAGSDFLAYGVLDAARNYGWKIPDQISLIGFDNLFFSRLVQVPLTTIDARIEELGKLAVRRLVEKIQGHRPGVEQMVLRPSLVVRDSCKMLKHG